MNSNEIVYAPVALESGSSSSSSAWSSGAVARWPESAAGSIDRATLSVEVAKTYAAEGHRQEALSIYRLLLEERPGDPEILAHIAELEKSPEERSRPPRPKLSPSATGPKSEPFGMLDLEELPEHYGVDEVEILFKDPWWSFVYWEVTESGLAAARAQLGHSGATARLMLRLFTTIPGPDGEAPQREVRDLPLSWNHGRRYIDIPRPGSLLRAAVGLLSKEGYFAPIATSSHWRLPPPNPAPTAERAREWLHVQPPRGRGEYRERLTILHRIVDHHERGPSWRVSGHYQELPSFAIGDASELPTQPDLSDVHYELSLGGTTLGIGSGGGR